MNMFFKKISLILFLSLSFMSFSANAFCPFEEGKPFQKKVNPLVILKWHQAVRFHDEGPTGLKVEGMRPGFKIFTFSKNPDEQREIGYIIVASTLGNLDISWLRIERKEDQRKGYATAAIETVMSIYTIYKIHRGHIYPNE